MNDKELNDVLEIIKANYQNFFKNETINEQKLRLKTWKYQFANIPQELMFQAVMEYIAIETSFPPSIGHINKAIDRMTNQETLGAEESFEHILTLINRYGSDAQSFKIASKEFSDVEKLIIKQGYYKELGLSGDPLSVLKGQYCRAYNNKKESVTHSRRLNLPNVDILKLISDRKLLGD